LIQFFTFDCTNAISQIAAFTGLVRNPAERKTDHGTQSHKCLILQRVPDMLSIASMNADPAVSSSISRERYPRRCFGSRTTPLSYYHLS
jgi:hypothetical protein